MLRRLPPRYIANLASRAAGHAAWVADQTIQRWKLRLTPADRLETIKRELLHDDRPSWPPPQITLTLPARRFGHKASYIDEFLESFVRTTERPDRVEMLIKIDEDDDFLFFHALKTRYEKQINICFFLSERKAGYASLNDYYASLVSEHSASSRIWMLQSSDGLFKLPQWDTCILAAAEGFTHDYFVITDCSFDEAISIKGPYPVKPEPVYWVRGALFPIMGFGILCCTAAIASRYPGWTSLGNTTNVDGFAGDILRRLWQRHGINVHAEVPLFSVENKPRGWEGVKDREQLRTRNLLAFFYEENQRIRDEMVDLIAGELRNPQHSPAMIPLA